LAIIYSTTTQAGIDINNVFFLDTSALEYPNAPFLAGELAWGTDGSEWVYGQSSATFAAGSVVVFSPTPGLWSVAAIGSGSLQKTTLGYLVGVTGGATGSVVVGQPTGTQKQNFFWVQRAGNAQAVLGSGTFAAGVQLHSTIASAGQVGTASGAATTVAINGIAFSQPGTNQAKNAVLNYPFVGSND
jgi:hypothetical protein